MAEIIQFASRSPATALKSRKRAERLPAIAQTITRALAIATPYTTFGGDPYLLFQADGFSVCSCLGDASKTVRVDRNGSVVFSGQLRAAGDHKASNWKGGGWEVELYEAVENAHRLKSAPRDPKRAA